MKKLAACNFEDLLQVQTLHFAVKLLTNYKCAIPVFKGLLPKKHNRIIQKLLFKLSIWHGLAKLRLHTEMTVNALKTSTT